MTLDSTDGSRRYHRPSVHWPEYGHRQHFSQQGRSKRPVRRSTKNRKGIPLQKQTISALFRRFSAHSKLDIGRFQWNEKSGTVDARKLDRIFGGCVPKVSDNHKQACSRRPREFCPHLSQRSLPRWGTDEHDYDIYISFHLCLRAIQCYPWSDRCSKKIYQTRRYKLSHVELKCDSNVAVCKD